MLKPWPEAFCTANSKKGLQRTDYVIRFPSELHNSMLWLAAGCLLVFAEGTMRGNSTVIGAPASPCLSVLIISDHLGAAFFAGLTRYCDAARTYEEARRECECICSDAFTKKVWNVWVSSAARPSRLHIKYQASALLYQCSCWIGCASYGGAAQGEEREAGEELEAETVRSAWQTLLHDKRGAGGDGGGSSDSGGRSGGGHESSGGEGGGGGSRDSGKRGGGAAAGMVESRARL